MLITGILVFLAVFATGMGLFCYHDERRLRLPGWYLRPVLFWGCAVVFLWASCRSGL